MLKLLLHLLQLQQVELGLIAGLLELQLQHLQRSIRLIDPLIGHGLRVPSLGFSLAMHAGMTTPLTQGLRKLETDNPDLNLVYAHRQFRSLAEFEPFLRQEQRGWPAAVQHLLQRVAVGGIRDPISDAPIPPTALQVEHGNLRETISHGGVISRQRAVLLVLRQLVEEGKLPPLEELRLYLSEAVTPFAARLRSVLPKLRCSEYLPEPDHRLRGKVANRDLRRIGLPPATFHAVVCNEVLEHVEQWEPSLQGLAEVLSLGGYLIATVPFLYGQQQHLVKAIWQGDDQPPQLIGEPDYHGNPVDEQGSLVYRYPGWQLLSDLRQAGFRDAAIHTISSTAYGVSGEELPLVFVLVAQR